MPYYELRRDGNTSVRALPAGLKELRLQPVNYEFHGLKITLDPVLVVQLDRDVPHLDDGVQKGWPSFMYFEDGRHRLSGFDNKQKNRKAAVKRTMFPTPRIINVSGKDRHTVITVQSVSNILLYTAKAFPSSSLPNTSPTMATVSVGLARILAPSAFVVNFAAQLYGMLSKPNMKEIADKVRE